MTIQVKATSQYFSVALFTVLFNVVLSFWIRIFCMVGWGVQGGFDPKVLWGGICREDISIARCLLLYFSLKI